MGSDKDYEVAYRCVAYSMAVAPIIVLISIIPYLAGIVRTLWGCFLLYTASTEVHAIKVQTAKVVFGIFAIIGLLSGISSEHTARKWQGKFETAINESNIEGRFKNLENMQDLTPEEAGQKAGEFLKGLQEFSKGLEESQKAEEAAKQD